MNKPLISIIVPVYNIMEYLPRCVESLQAQTYSNIEILLVDDGSTDGTGALCDRLAEQDGRIRVFHKQNGGPSSARNLGILNSEGEYLGFVDSDDFVDSDMYELLYQAIEQFQVSVAQVGRDELDMEGNRLPDICIPPEKTECIENETFLRELLMHRGDCSFCTKLMKKSLFDKEQFPIGVLNEDFHLLVHLLPEIGRIASLPKQAYHVFYRSDSNTRKKTSFSRVFADNIDNADMVYEIVKKDYPQLLSVAFRFGIFQRLDYMLHIPISQMTSDNSRYRRVVADLRRGWCRGLANPYLTLKNKCYHTLFAIAPRTIRVVHKKLKRL
ncbi:MAG: glycosyltransferase family 2 protein [Acetatifactor sp.]